jgi:hypothetical protein
VGDADGDAVAELSQEGEARVKERPAALFAEDAYFTAKGDRIPASGLQHFRRHTPPGGRRRLATLSGLVAWACRPFLGRWAVGLISERLAEAVTSAVLEKPVDHAGSVLLSLTNRPNGALQALDKLVALTARGLP